MPTYESRIRQIPLLKRYKASTDGSASILYLDLEVPEFTNILPLAESLTLLSLTEGAPSGGEFEWNIGFLSGFDRTHQGSFFPLETSATHINGNGSARTSPYTTVLNFNLDSRLQLLVKNKNTFSGVRSATLSAWLLVQTVGQ